ncbi:hypothetical protein [Actinoplanes sp. NBRC 103695]|uniref:hypothetical protein n=1 Tax=Actinoplanes sp. NBRC 103695 TaxID=3032202 RepID=UPI0024A0926E|nr:hypothetical protein [Actinoplanes sp. NBRC 103695]GLZ02304.1 hypothetical protein Acsp02_95550 [Actinoplanes sp. NBRC 103695]
MKRYVVASELGCVDDMRMTDAETYVLAGFAAGSRWMPTGRDRAGSLPRAVATVSECLAEFLPVGRDTEPWLQPMFAPWYRTLKHAADAVRHAPPNPTTAHVLSMSLPATSAITLAAMIEKWIGDLPHPIQINLAQPAAAPPGTVHGFEVLGFEAGRFHSWLCYRLDVQALDSLGIRTGNAGLLTTLDDALLVVDMATNYRGTDDGTPEDVTWFVSLITEHDID